MFYTFLDALATGKTFAAIFYFSIGVPGRKRTLTQDLF